MFLLVRLPIAMLLAAALPAAHAQGAGAPPSSLSIYTCIDDQGRKITSDRPIASCSAREQRVLNKDGSLKAVVPPTLTAEELAAKEAKERKLAEARAAQAEAVRRDRNLLQRYPTEARHQKARESALDTVRVAMKATEARLKVLEAAYQMADAEQRAMVLLHILSQPVPVQIDAASLRKTG